jgi:hypothetical protein
MAAAEAGPCRSTDRLSSRETVAVFDDYNVLVAAIEDLELAGFDRAQINLLTSRKGAEPRLGHEVQDILEREDEAQLPLGTWVDRHELAEGKTALAAGLAYVASFTAIGVSVAAESGLTEVIAAGAASGGSGGALGMWLAGMIGRHRIRAIEEQRRCGGLLLWVETHGPRQEQKAIEILEHHATGGVHLREPRRASGIGQARLPSWQPDPYLLK